MVLPFFPDKKSPAAALGNPEKFSDKTAVLVKPKSIKIAKILTADLVLAAPPGIGKNQLIELLVGRLRERKGLADPGLLARVLEREQGISTTLDTGLSLPHGRTDSIRNIVAALGLVPQGIVDPNAGGLTIRLMFLFVSPNRPETLPLHLQLLRGVASLFQPELIKQLASAADPAAALDIIRGVEAR
jgi:mannitol/fructose-specific phosphotransferase system IIA component (Ntr-type)